MTQVASKVDIAYDWELWIGRTVDSALVWTQIYGWEALPFPDQVPDDIDVTHMQSPGRTRETIPGLLPIGEWSQEKQYWPGDPGDVLLEALAALTAAGTKEDVLIEYNLDPDGSSARRTYRGYVNSFTPMGPVGEKSMTSVALRIFERQSSNARVIA